MASRPRRSAAQSSSSETALRKFDQRLDRLEKMLERLTDKVSQENAHGDHGANADVSFCHLPPVPERTFDASVSSARAELIRYNDKKWVNGTTLRYYFFTDAGLAGHASNLQLVRDGFKVWDDVGIGITFEEVEDIHDADVRIGFKRGDGAWSYVGRDVRDIPGQNERTMNFGWDLRRDRRGVDTPVHEIGHTLGFPHEHQNPFSGIVWDEEAVYRHFAGSPNNWSRDRTFHNILRKLSSRDVEGSGWDPDSIMHYSFDRDLIIEPARYRTGLTPAPGLSETDKAEVRKFYPKAEAADIEALEPLQSAPLDLAATQQRNFVLTPDATRNYQIRAFGESDVLMVLMRRDGDRETFIAGSDDSGTPDNAAISTTLEADTEYVLRIRMFSQHGADNTAVMYW